MYLSVQWLTFKCWVIYPHTLKVHVSDSIKWVWLNCAMWYCSTGSYCLVLVDSLWPSNLLSWPWSSTSHKYRLATSLQSVGYGSTIPSNVPCIHSQNKFIRIVHFRQKKQLSVDVYNEPVYGPALRMLRETCHMQLGAYAPDHNLFTKSIFHL